MSPLFSQNTHVHSGLTHVRTFHKPVLMWTVLIQNAVPSGIIRSHVTQILPSMPCRHCQPAHTRDEGQLPFWPCPFLITKFLRKFHFHLVFCGIWPLRCCWRVTPFAECAESPAAQLLCVIFRVTQSHHCLCRIYVSLPHSNTLIYLGKVAPATVSLSLALNVLLTTSSVICG